MLPSYLEATSCRHGLLTLPCFQCSSERIDAMQEDNSDREVFDPYTDADRYDHDSASEDGPFPSAAWDESLGNDYDIEAQASAPPGYSAPISRAIASKKPIILLHASMEHSANSSSAVIDHLLRLSLYARTLQERLAATEAIPRVLQEQNHAKQPSDRARKAEEKRGLWCLVRYGVRLLAEAFFELLLHFISFFVVAFVVVFVVIFVVAIVLAAGMSSVEHSARTRIL